MVSSPKSAVPRSTFIGSDLLLCDPQQQVFQLERAAGGNPQPFGKQTPAGGNWSMIVPGNFIEGSQFTDLLCYDPGQQILQFFAWDPQTQRFVQKNGPIRGVRPNWSMIVAGNLTGGPFNDLLFYLNDPNDRILEFYQSNGQGEINIVSSHHNEPPNHLWSLIVPGNFG